MLVWRGVKMCFLGNLGPKCDFWEIWDQSGIWGSLGPSLGLGLVQNGLECLNGPGWAQVRVWCGLDSDWAVIELDWAA